MSIWRSHQTLWSLPLPSVTWHSGTWPYTMTPSIDQALHRFANLLPNWTLLPILTSLPNFGGFHRTLQRVRLANRGRLLLRTPGPVPAGACICSNVDTILSWTCHVYGHFECCTYPGTSILPSSSWSTGSILVLSNVLFLCKISVTFVSCTQRSRLTLVSYSRVFVSHCSCAYRFLLNSCHVRGWFACGLCERSGAFVSHSQLLRGIVFSFFTWQ